MWGTICSHGIENAGGSSKRRSPESACPTQLLHNRPVGLCVRGTQFYCRRRVPHDARALIGRTEIWRSLWTDSLKSPQAGCRAQWLGSRRRSNIIDGWRDWDFPVVRMRYVERELLQEADVQRSPAAFSMTSK
ncbi:DUF6538 domain-containing protein [Sphingobium sp. OAS761]|uniref:DUF6538 domain-containing protein n=1 Tax=Sphingobium sp. OAS761 TaxID=2817901 RepID=UPI00345F4416